MIINFNATDQVDRASRARLEIAEDGEAMRHIGDISADVIDLASIRSQAIRNAEDELGRAVYWLKFRQSQLATYRGALAAIKSGIALSWNRPFDIEHQSMWLRAFWFNEILPARRNVNSLRARYRALARSAM